MRRGSSKLYFASILRFTTSGNALSPSKGPPGATLTIKKADSNND